MDLDLALVAANHNFAVDRRRKSIYMAQIFKEPTRKK